MGDYEIGGSRQDALVLGNTNSMYLLFNYHLSVLASLKKISLSPSLSFCFQGFLDCQNCTSGSGIAGYAAGRRTSDDSSLHGGVVVLS